MGCGCWLSTGGGGSAVLHGYLTPSGCRPKVRRKQSPVCCRRTSPTIGGALRRRDSATGEDDRRRCSSFRWSLACRWRSSMFDGFFGDGWMFVVVSVVVVLLCYVNSLRGDFVHDDLVAVVSNPDVTGKNPWTSMWKNDFWGKPMADPSSHKSYRPLTVMTFRLNSAVNGNNVVGYHAVNVALHCACVFLVAWLAQHIFLWDRVSTLTAVLLFATHPIHSEAVASIVGRADVLCCVFFLLSFMSFHKSLKERVSVRRRVCWLVLCVLSAASALLAKEQGVTVVAVCLLLKIYSLWNATEARESAIRRIIFFLARCFLDIYVVTLSLTLGVLLSFRLWMLNGTMPQFSEQDNPASFAPFVLTRFLTYCYLAAFNAWLLLCPLTLSYDWQMGSIPLVQSLWDVRNGASVTLFLAVAGLLWRSSRTSKEQQHQQQDRFSALVVFLAICILPFIPASNILVTVGFVVAERILYIPSIGFCLLVAQGTKIMRQRGTFHRRLSFLLTFALVAVFTTRTIQRNTVWSSREALFESGLKEVPNNAKVHYNFANLQKDLGNTELAVKHYNIALQLCPNHASAHNNLGTLLTSTPESERHFLAALKINPHHPGAHFNLANIYSKQGQKEVAVSLLKRAIELDLEFTEAYSSLANIYAEEGKTNEAEKLHKVAVTTDPKHADAHNNYGTFLQTHGRVEEAVKEYQVALEVQPNHTVALVNAARTLRTMKLNREAENLYKRALAVQEDPQIMDNLAVFYINAGRLDEAKRMYEIVQVDFPDHLESKVHFAQLLMQQRSFSAAEELLIETIQRNSTHREALHQIALLYNYTNRTAEALDYILKALRLCQIDDKSCAQLHAEHGDILKDLNDLNTSAESYSMAIQLDPKLAHAHLNLAVIKHLQGDYHTAFRHYHTAYALDPENQLIADNMEKLRRRLVQPLRQGSSSSFEAGTDAEFKTR